jgi:hypothetical protein
VALHGRVGLRTHVQATLDTVSAQRRPLTDPLGLQGMLLTIVRAGPVQFGGLVEQTAVPRWLARRRCICSGLVAWESI